MNITLPIIEASPLQLKAEMLCLGVDVTAARGLAAHLDSDPRSFIHGTVFRLDNGWIVNTSLWSALSASSAVHSLPRPRIIRDSAGRLRVVGSTCEMGVEVLTLGDTGQHEVQNLRAADWFSLHSPNTLFCAPVRQCIFITAGKPCLFCTFESGKVELLARSAFEATLRSILTMNPGIKSLAIGGGTPQLIDMGANYFADLTRSAVSLGLSVSVEMVPPPDLRSLAALKVSGVSSLIMSLETWNDADRERWCLGKSGVSKQHYLSAWAEACRLWGDGQVASVLLLGTEDSASTMEGAEELIRHGVVPTIIPLRLYGDSRFKEWRPVLPDLYIRLERRIAMLMRRSGLSASGQAGCTACGGCSLDTAVEQHSVLSPSGQTLIRGVS